MKEKQFSNFLAFLERLDNAKITYDLEHSRDDAVMIIIFIPGEHWEVEFLEDGSVEVERYRSNGHIDDESALAELFMKCSDEEVPATHDATART
jgi:hypothetical protein